MFVIRICFSQTPDADAVAGLCASLAGARRGAPVALSPGPRAILPDPNPGADACVDAHWTGPGVTLHLRVAGGDGSPREGFGYTCALRLTVDDPDGRWEARVSANTWVPIPAPLEVTVVGFPLGQLPALRAAVARAPGSVDLATQPGTARSLIAALMAEGHTGLARDLAVEAVAASSPDSFGHGELLDWALRLDPALGGVARRLRETPERVDAWEAALAQPPDGCDPADLRVALAHLCPEDGARWVAAGLPPPPWLSAPRWPLARPAPAAGEGWWTPDLGERGHGITANRLFLEALLGKTEDRDAAIAPPVTGVDGWTCVVSRRAHWRPGERVPRAVVTLNAQRPSASGGTGVVAERVDTQEWAWVSGASPGDVAVSLRQTWSLAPGLDAAVAWTVVGSPAFRDAVRAAWDRALPFRWASIDGADLHRPWPERPLPWFAALADAGPVAIAAEVLAAADLSPAHRDQALEQLSCRCPQERRPPCPHRLALFAVERAQRVAGPAPGAAERLRARARQQALQVALAAIGEAPDPAAVRRALAVAHGQLVEVAALR